MKSNAKKPAPTTRTSAPHGRTRHSRRPVLTLADQLLAVALHYRLGLPQVAVAVLFTVRAETVNRRLRETRQLLDHAGYTIPPSPHRIDTIADLHDYATAGGVLAPNIKKAS